MANIWTDLGNLSLGFDQSDLMGGFVRGKLVIVSGHGVGGNIGKVAIWNPVTESWSYGPQNTGVNGEGAYAIIENRLHIIVNDFHGSYDVDTNTWAAHEPLPLARRRYLMQGGAIGGKIYVVGGYNSGAKNWLDVYNPATNSWSQGPNIPTTDSFWGTPVGIAWSRTAVTPTELHVLAGQTGLPGDGIKQHWVYIPTTNSWVRRTDYPGPVDGGDEQMFVYGGGYIWGGHSDTSGNFYAYSVADDVWTLKADLTGVTGSGVTNGLEAYYNKHVYYAGPRESGLYRYEPDVTLIPEYGEFEGDVEASNTIYPAPEPIPHRFTEADFPNMDRAQARRLARMLNSNFESAERQLLALDPDTQGNRFGR